MNLVTVARDPENNAVWKINDEKRVAAIRWRLQKRRKLPASGSRLRLKLVVSTQRCFLISSRCGLCGNFGNVVCMSTFQSRVWSTRHRLIAAMGAAVVVSFALKPGQWNEGLFVVVAKATRLWSPVSTNMAGGWNHYLNMTNDRSHYLYAVIAGITAGLLILFAKHERLEDIVKTWIAAATGAAIGFGCVDQLIMRGFIPHSASCWITWQDLEVDYLQHKFVGATLGSLVGLGVLSIFQRECRDGGSLAFQSNPPKIGS
jgi:hypothetical protein